MSTPARADTERFLATIRDRSSGLNSDEDAIAATNAVLAQLGDYVSGDAARRLAAAAPEAFAGLLRSASREPSGGTSDEFLAAVAKRQGSGDLTVAADHVQAVFRALAETVDRAAVASVREQLTGELRLLLADESQGDTSQRMASGPIEPDAPNVAGPERAVRRP